MGVNSDWTMGRMPTTQSDLGASRRHSTAWRMSMRVVEGGGMSVAHHGELFDLLACRAGTELNSLAHEQTALAGT